MDIEFDPQKALDTLPQRGLDFARALEIFDTNHLTILDDRFDYGQTKQITVELLDGRMVILVWTPTGNNIRIISMRKANDREQALYRDQLGRPG